MTRLFRRPRPQIALLAVVALVTACGGQAVLPATTVPATVATSTIPVTTAAPTTTTQAAPLPLRIGVTPGVANGIPFIMAAEETAIGAANGLAITVEIFDSAGEALDAALAGQVDVILPGARTVIRALADGACFVAPLDFIDQDNTRLVGRSDLFTTQDLIEHRVGTVQGGVGEIALRMWLSDAGVAWDEVEVVDTPAQDLAEALAAGDVDAIIWTEPVPAAALAACGEEACHYFGDIGASYREVALVTVTCDWQQAHRGPGMERLVRAWLEAKEYLRNNVESSAAIAAERLHLTAEEVAALWLERGWLDAWGANLTDGQLAMIEAYGAYLVEAGDLAESPEVCSWVSSRWLAAVAPSLVTLDEYRC